MDDLDEDILATLMDGKPRNFNQLLKEIDLSHNTLRLHLDYLVEEDLVRREKTRGGGRGRPIYAYSLASAGRGSASTSPCLRRHGVASVSSSWADLLLRGERFL